MPKNILSETPVKELFGALVGRKKRELIVWKEDRTNFSERFDEVTLDYFTFIAASQVEVKEALKHERNKKSKIDSEELTNVRLLLQELAWQHTDVTSKMINSFTATS